MAGAGGAVTRLQEMVACKGDGDVAPQLVTDVRVVLRTLADARALLAEVRASMYAWQDESQPAEYSWRWVSETRHRQERGLRSRIEALLKRLPLAGGGMQ